MTVMRLMNAVSETDKRVAGWLLEHYFINNSSFYYSDVVVPNKVYRYANKKININLVIGHVQGRYSIAAPSAFNNLAVNITVDIDSTELPQVAKAKTVLSNANLPSVVSFSGKKGYHLTVLFQGPVPLAQAQNLSRTIQQLLASNNIQYDRIYPSPHGKGGDGISLPLGKHPETGNVCHFIDDSFLPVNDLLAFIDSVQYLDLSNISTFSSTIDENTGEIKTTYPTVISTRPCINVLWNEGLQAAHTRHSATLVIANSVMRSASIPPQEKENALIDWINRIYLKSKTNGFIDSTTDLNQAVSEARRLFTRYKLYRTHSELCENPLFKPAMRSACIDEYQCRLQQNHGSADYMLMNDLGIFAAPNAKPKGLGKAVMAIYQAIERVVQDYQAFEWHGHQVFTLSIQQLIRMSSCSRKTVVDGRKKLLEVGLLVKIPKTDLPLTTINKYPHYVEFYYLSEINESVIKNVLKYLRRD